MCRFKITYNFTASKIKHDIIVNVIFFNYDWNVFIVIGHLFTVLVFTILTHKKNIIKMNSVQMNLN